MTISLDPSILGLSVQLCAAILIAILFLLLERGEAPTFHRWWTAAWCCLSAALLARWVGFSTATPWALWAYQAFELFFVFALWRGARALGGSETSPRTARIAGGAIAVWAAAVTGAVTLAPGGAAAERISATFAAHAPLMFLGFGLSAVATWRLSRTRRGWVPGCCPPRSRAFFSCSWGTRRSRTEHCAAAEPSWSSWDTARSWTSSCSSSPPSRCS